MNRTRKPISSRTPRARQSMRLLLVLTISPLWAWTRAQRTKRRLSLLNSAYVRPRAQCYFLEWVTHVYLDTCHWHAVQKVPLFSFFHHLGSGNGAPHSFTSMVRRQLVLPRIVVFLAIRIVDVPRLDEEDTILINKFRSLEGEQSSSEAWAPADTFSCRFLCHEVTPWLSSRCWCKHLCFAELPVLIAPQLRNLGKPVLERIIQLERGTTLPGQDEKLDRKLELLREAAKTVNHMWVITTLEKDSRLLISQPA